MFTGEEEMAPVSRMTASSSACGSVQWQHWRAYVSCLLLLLVVACSSSPFERINANNVPPLQLPDRLLTVSDVDQLISTPELLALDDGMRRFVANYAGKRGSQRQRLFNLHRAIKSADVLDMHYDPFAGGTAADAFNRGSANCLSYANMFVAMAREAGLRASYQWLEVKPEWTRMGERVAVRLHVNVLVKTRQGEEFMVDIDPLQSADIADSKLIKDADAQALYHSNFAMGALAEERLEEAWLHAVRAIQLSPKTGHLWINLGAIYRLAGQYEDAEQSYFYALQFDSHDRSAMNNLVVLYNQQGREAEHGYWTERIKRYRRSNPYYYTWLGDQAGEEDDWEKAKRHYEHALELMPRDSRMIYALGIIHYRLGDYDGATEHIAEAIDLTYLRGDIETYTTQLEVVKQKQLASQ
ncbi:MAG: Flp pilus assembly protein TadD [Halieaceae bacterium]|jgi:Flp pilus assembly protein TadD